MDESKGGFDGMFGEDEVREVLRESFYAPAQPKAAKKTKKAKKKAKKPDHYDVICISLYKEDLGRLDQKVQALKAKGHRKMSRSALIRYALDTVDLDALPRSY